MSSEPSPPTANAATSASAVGTVSDQGGGTATVAFSLGDPRPSSEVNDAGVSSCETYLGTLNQTDSTAIPVHIEVTSAPSEDITVSLGQVSEVQDGGEIGTPDAPVLWAETYSDTPPQCQTDNGGVVHWPASAGSRSWSAWIVVPGANSDTAQRLLFSPAASAGQSSSGEVQFNSPAAPIVVQCSDSDPAAGSTSYLAADPATALEHGCTSTADQQAATPGSTPTADQICNARYPSGQSHTIQVTGGTNTVYDRQSSLEQVCSGFGYPQGLEMTPGMSCAVIAAIATYGGPVASQQTDNLCTASSVVEGYHTHGWLGAVSSGALDKGCGYISDVFAAGAGITAAGLSSETGPGAVAVGVGTYEAFSAGLKLVCGFTLGGEGTALGTKLEADNETHIALDVIHNGKCMILSQKSGISGTSWHSTACPSA